MLFAQAQDRHISGVVHTSDNIPIPFATVALFNRDSLYINGSITDSLGKFSIKTNSDCRFLNVNHIYYKAERISIESDHQNPITIILQPETQQIEEITVVRDAIIYKNGSILVNVSQLPGIKNMQANKVLEQLPGVIKTNRDGYTLNGLNATIYINGIKQQISEKSLASYLEALPANVLSEIELVPNTSGNYDASTNAVIHIKTKKNMPEGTYFQIGTSASIFDGDLNNAGGDLFYMVKKKNVLFNSLISYSNDNNFGQSSDSTVYASGTTIVNRGHTKGRNNVITSQNNLTLSLNNDHRLDFNVFIYYDIDNYKNYWDSKTVSDNSSVDSRYYYKARGNNDMWSGSIYYTSPQDRNFKLKTYYTGLYGGIRTKNRHFATLEDNDPYMKSDIGMVGHMHTFAADMENAASSNISFLYGAKLNLNIVNDHADYQDVSDNTYFSRSKFRGQEIIPAGYFMTRYSLTKSFSMMASARVEHTDYKLNLKSESLTHSNSYTNFFPSTVLYMNTQKYNGTLGFYSGISRPNYEWLLPGIRYVNDYYYTEGNPYLDPMKFYYVAFNNRFLKLFQLNLRYERLNNLYGAVYMKDGNSSIYRTYLNYADLNRYYIGITLPYRFLNGKLYGQLMGTIRWEEYRNFKNNFELPEGRKSRFFNSNIRFNLLYDITDRLSSNFIARIDPNYKNIQVETKTVYNIDLGFYYSFLAKKNLILGLNASNLFNSADSKQDIYFLDNFRHSYNRIKGPVFNISLKLRINKGQNVMDEYQNKTPAIERMPNR